MPLQAEARYRELVGLGLSVNLVLVGNKGKQYFSRRPQYNVVSEWRRQPWRARAHHACSGTLAGRAHAMHACMRAACERAKRGFFQHGSSPAAATSAHRTHALANRHPCAPPPPNRRRAAESFSLGATPTTREAQAIADEIFADFVSAEADKVELVYTKFVSLITSTPTIQTLLPLTPTGELCDVDGKCVDAAEDEIFKLTTQARCFLLQRQLLV